MNDIKFITSTYENALMAIASRGRCDKHPDKHSGACFEGEQNPAQNCCPQCIAIAALIHEAAGRHGWLGVSKPEPHCVLIFNAKVEFVSEVVGPFYSEGDAYRHAEKLNPDTKPWIVAKMVER
jgi:hypothetical protein